MILELFSLKSHKFYFDHPTFNFVQTDSRLKYVDKTFDKVIIPMAY